MAYMYNFWFPLLHVLLIHPGRCKISVTCTGGIIFQVKLKKNPQLLLYVSYNKWLSKSFNKARMQKINIKRCENRTPYYYMHIFHYFIFHNCNTCLYIADQDNHTEASHYTYIYIYPTLIIISFI